MKLTISFKHLDHTPALDSRIQEKSERLKKYFDGALNVQWICWVVGDEQWAEIKVRGPKIDFFAKASAGTMYKALDLVLDKIERQISKKKQITSDKHHDRLEEVI